MRTRCAIVVAVVALAACGSSSGSASGAACGPSAAKTLAADSTARVYLSAGDVYGCSGGRGRSFLLGASERSIREGRAGPIALAGTVVAYGYTSFGVDTFSAQVVVRDLAGGRRLRVEPGTTRPAGAEFFESIGSVAVKADGATAWIGRSSSIVSRATLIQVNRADRRGVATLDSGAAIASSSLRLRGSMLSWSDAGHTRSASLD